MRRAPRASQSRSVRRTDSSSSLALLQAQVEPLEQRQLLSSEVISVNLAGTSTGNGQSDQASVSGDGRYVVFVSTSTDLVAGDTNGHADVFLRDRQANTTTLISKASNGDLGNGDSIEPKISNDGTYVVFTSAASNLVAGDTPTFGSA